MLPTSLNEIQFILRMRVNVINYSIKRKPKPEHKQQIKHIDRDSNILCFMLLSILFSSSNKSYFDSMKVN